MCNVVRIFTARKHKLGEFQLSQVPGTWLLETM